MAPGSPPGTTPGPYHLIAFWTGPVVALCGVWPRPGGRGGYARSEALREASVDTWPMTWGRWIIGVGTLGTALVVMGLASPIRVGDQRKTYPPTRHDAGMAFALLAPVAVAPVTRVLTLPVRRLRGPAGCWCGKARYLVRRTAAIAAPVLVTVGLAASLGGASGTIDAAKNREDQQTLLADFVVRPVDAPGFSRPLVDRLSAIEGIDVAAPVPTSVYNVHRGIQLVARPVQAVQPTALPRVLNLPMVAGSIADLDDDSIVVSPYWSSQVGDVVDVWLADGTQAKLRVAAVMADGALADAYVTPSHGTALAALIYVRLKPDTDAGTAEAALRAATVGAGAEVTTRADWFARAAGRQGEASRLGLLIVLGIVLGYTAIAIVNTLLMAASERGRDIATLRLNGATPGQILRIFAVESLLAVAVGVVLAIGTAAVGVLGLWVALLRLVGPTAIVIPWQLIGLVAAGSAVLAVVATVAATASRLRRPAIELAGASE